MIQTLLRFSVAAFLLATLALGSATPVFAQYMFLDSNGDGRNTVGDRIAFMEGTNDFTTVDIWLETDRNRDGSPVTCATGEALSLTSYEIALSSNGAVSYGAFTNLLPGFASVQQVVLSSSFYAHFTSGAPLPPGKHRLATLKAGARDVSNLEIVTSNFITGSRTAFGSECGGAGSPRVLGLHWSDTAGLEFGTVDHYPIFVVPALNMVVPAGASMTQGIETRDPDGMSFVTTQIESGPSYVTLETREADRGYEILRVHASPGFGDVGTANVVLRLSDTNFSVTDEFQITVTPPVNPPVTVDFETPLLGDAIRQVVDPYAHPSGATFRAGILGTLPGVVGLIQNSATGCAGPSDTNQRLGSAPSATPIIGGAGYPIEVTFAAPLQPPVWASVEVKLGFSAYGELRLFDVSGNEVGFSRDFAYPPCSPSDFRSTVTITAGSTQPVASARFQGPNGMVFTADDFRFAHGVAAGAPLVLAPSTVSVAEGVLLSIPVSAFDPEGDPIASLDAALAGLPLGNDASFTKNPANTSGTLVWTPDFTHAGTYSVSFTAVNGGGSASATTSISVANTNRVPVAEAGGPYTGVVGIPIAFSAGGSSDPDGDALTYFWMFGDTNTGMGSEVSHTYTAPGAYSVVVGVSDGTQVDQDGTSATIVPFLDARAFQSKPNRKIALSSGSSAVCIQLEPVAGAYANGDVDLSTLVMISPGTGSVSQIPAIADKSVLVGDTDQSGVEEIAACFTRRDLRLLFANVDGHVTVPVSLEARLVSGVTIHGEVDLNVTGTGGNLAASVYPNPLNPNATITFVTTRGGAARVKLFSADGRLVRTLLETRALPAGYHDVPVDGLGETGGKLASGIYYYVVEAREGTVSGRLAIVK